MDDASSDLRIGILQAGIVLALVFLGLKLGQLQIARRAEYDRLADTNRFRLTTVDPPRGVMYDRNGQILVRNVPSFSLSVVPAGLPEAEPSLAQLSDRLAVMLNRPQIEAQDGTQVVASAHAADAEGGPHLSTQDVLDRLEDIRLQVDRGEISAHALVPLVGDVPRDVAFVAQEDQAHLPGVVVEITPERQYLEGALLAHWLGYVGPMPGEDVASYLSVPGNDYTPRDQVGLAGIERSFEAVLRGKKGKKHVEVDAFEREMGVLATKPEEPGDSLVLTLDLELQKVATAALQERMDMVGAESGSVVAMNPQTGEILAMVSLPSYDNNLFSGGISAEDYGRLASDPLSPLLNHAIGGEYPPGSTIKIVPASAALEEGVISPQTTFTCEGIMWLPNEFLPDDPALAQPFYCWRKEGHGRVDLSKGLAYSCDIYFYQVGGGFLDAFEGLGLERLGHYSRAFGFGELTGIDLSGEVAGLVPTERWKREMWDANWVTGDTYNVSIGQGYILATPLQELNSVAALANGGTLYRPQVVKQVIDSEGAVVRTFVPEVIRELPVSDKNIQIVREGMRDAVQWGTAILLELDLPEIHAAGKTGTAEFPGERDEEGHLPTHAWFGGFAPFKNPEIAIVVFIADGGQGALESVPVASKVLRHYFQIPDPTPTPVP